MNQKPRCNKCHKVHGPAWGERQCKEHQQLLLRIRQRDQRQSPPMTTDGNGKYI
jgi:hypothetical protein